MKRPAPRDLARAVLSAVYFLANAVFLHAAESNLWSDRRALTARADQKKAGSPLASLPPSSDPLTVLKGLPDVRAAALSPGVADRLAADVPRAAVARYEGLLRSIPSSEGVIRRLSLPKTSGGPTVVFLQDVHKNDEAQARLGRIVESLMSSGRAPVVALEAAFGPMDLEKRRSFEVREAVRMAADYLLKEHRISGPVHAAYLHEGPLPAFVGVDDLDHWRRNIDAYRRSAPVQAEAAYRLKGAERRLQEEKDRAFSPALLAFDRVAAAYRRGRLSFGDYVRALDAAGAPRGAQTGLFLGALATEKAMDFKVVEGERERLIESVVRKTSPDQVDRLLRMSVEYRAGSLGPADYYGALKALCVRSGVDLARFPAMDEYMRYVATSGRIDADKLLSEVMSAEKAVYGRLAATPEEKRLVAESRGLSLAGRLLDFSLTPVEWAEYQAAPSAAPGVDFSSFEDFYREAEARNHAMAGRLLKAMSDRKASVAVLVAGGFHTAGMTKLLTDRGAAVIEVAPRLTKADGPGSAYLGAFTREKAPLEVLFKGDRLFVADQPDRVEMGVVEALAALWLLPQTSLDVAQKWFLSLTGGALVSDSVRDGTVAARVRAGGKTATLSLKVRGGDILFFTQALAVGLVGAAAGYAAAGVGQEMHLFTGLLAAAQLATGGFLHALNGLRVLKAAGLLGGTLIAGVIGRGGFRDVREEDEAAVPPVRKETDSGNFLADPRFGAKMDFSMRELKYYVEEGWLKPTSENFYAWGPLAPVASSEEMGADEALEKVREAAAEYFMEYRPLALGEGVDLPRPARERLFAVTINDVRFTLNFSAGEAKLMQVFPATKREVSKRLKPGESVSVRIEKGVVAFAETGEETPDGDAVLHLRADGTLAVRSGRSFVTVQALPAPLTPEEDLTLRWLKEQAPGAFRLDSPPPASEEGPIPDSPPPAPEERRILAVAADFNPAVTSGSEEQAVKHWVRLNHPGWALKLLRHSLPAYAVFADNRVREVSEKMSALNDQAARSGGKPIILSHGGLLWVASSWRPDDPGPYTPFLLPQRALAEASNKLKGRKWGPALSPAEGLLEDLKGFHRSEKYRAFLRIDAPDNPFMDGPPLDVVGPDSVVQGADRGPGARLFAQGKSSKEILIFIKGSRGNETGLAALRHSYAEEETEEVNLPPGYLPTEEELEKKAKELAERPDEFNLLKKEVADLRKEGWERLECCLIMPEVHYPFPYAARIGKILGTDVSLMNLGPKRVDVLVSVDGIATVGDREAAEKHPWPGPVQVVEEKPPTPEQQAVLDSFAAPPLFSRALLAFVRNHPGVVSMSAGPKTKELSNLKVPVLSIHTVSKDGKAGTYLIIPHGQEDTQQADPKAEMAVSWEEGADGTVVTVLQEGTHIHEEGYLALDAGVQFILKSGVAARWRSARPSDPSDPPDRESAAYVNLSNWNMGDFEVKTTPSKDGKTIFFEIRLAPGVKPTPLEDGEKDSFEIRPAPGEEPPKQERQTVPPESKRQSRALRLELFSIAAAARGESGPIRTAPADENPGLAERLEKLSEAQGLEEKGPDWKEVLARKWWKDMITLLDGEDATFRQVAREAVDFIVNDRLNECVIQGKNWEVKFVFIPINLREAGWRDSPSAAKFQDVKQSQSFLTRFVGGLVGAKAEPKPRITLYVSDRAGLFREVFRAVALPMFPKLEEGKRAAFQARFEELFQGLDAWDLEQRWKSSSDALLKDGTLPTRDGGSLDVNALKDPVVRSRLAKALGMASLEDLDRALQSFRQQSALVLRLSAAQESAAREHVKRVPLMQGVVAAQASAARKERSGAFHRGTSAERGAMFLLKSARSLNPFHQSFFRLLNEKGTGDVPRVFGKKIFEAVANASFEMVRDALDALDSALGVPGLLEEILEISRHEYFWLRETGPTEKSRELAEVFQQKFELFPGLCPKAGVKLQFEVFPVADAAAANMAGGDLFHLADFHIAGGTGVLYVDSRFLDKLSPEEMEYLVLRELWIQNFFHLMPSISLEEATRRTEEKLRGPAQDSVFAKAAALAGPDVLSPAPAAGAAEDGKIEPKPILPVGHAGDSDRFKKRTFFPPGKILGVEGLVAAAVASVLMPKWAFLLVQVLGWSALALAIAPAVKDLSASWGGVAGKARDRLAVRLGKPTRGEMAQALSQQLSNGALDLQVRNLVPQNAGAETDPATVLEQASRSWWSVVLYLTDAAFLRDLGNRLVEAQGKGEMDHVARGNRADARRLVLKALTRSVSPLKAAKPVEPGTSSLVSAEAATMDDVHALIKDLLPLQGGRPGRLRLLVSPALKDSGPHISRAFHEAGMTALRVELKVDEGVRARGESDEDFLAGRTAQWLDDVHQSERLQPGTVSVFVFYLKPQTPDSDLPPSTAAALAAWNAQNLYYDLNGVFPLAQKMLGRVNVERLVDLICKAMA